MRLFFLLAISVFSILQSDCHCASSAQQHQELLTKTNAFIHLVELQIQEFPALETQGDAAIQHVITEQPELFAWKQDCGPKNILRRHLEELTQRPAETLDTAHTLSLVQRWVDGTHSGEIKQHFDELRAAYGAFYITLQNDPQVQAERQHQREQTQAVTEQKLLETRAATSATIAQAEHQKNTALSAQEAIVLGLSVAEKNRNAQILAHEQAYGVEHRQTMQADQQAYEAKAAAHGAEEKVALARLEGEKVKTARTERTERHQRLLPPIIAGSTAALILAYFAGKRYFKGRPTLIEKADTSLLNWWEQLCGYKLPASNIDSVILEPALAHQVLDKFSGFALALQKGYPLSNMLFYGSPGTGKTMAAQAFARRLSEQKIAHHIIVRGPAFKRLGSAAKAQAALADILRLARTSPLPVILIFDEAETIFPDRSSPYATEMTNDLTTTMLSFFENAVDKKIMFILSTNYAERLDVALLNRIDPSNYVHFTKPGKAERVLLLSLYLKEHILDRKLEISDEIKNQKEYLAELLDGFVGRQIHSLVAQALYTMARYQTKRLELFMLKETLVTAQKNKTIVSE